MIFLQTLYITSNKDPFRDPFGWSSPEYHLMGWALSCLQLHKLYGNITLHANSPAAHLLIDTLQLPYTQVILSHDELTLIHPDLWALPKIYTYSLQQEPFLHIDGDVFLFKPFNSLLLEGNLIAQNVEVATENYYSSTQKEIMRHFTCFPPCVKKEFESGIPVQACNAGILGGNDLSFFHEYAYTAFEYINKNADVLKKINVNNFNVFFEQHLFYALLKEKGIPVSVLFEGVIPDRGYKYMGNFHDVPFNRSYLHLLGHFKRDEFTCIRMAEKLKELYPDYYERIVALFHKKNIRLSPCGFKNEPEVSTKRINERNNSHLRLLRFVADNHKSESDKDLFQSDFEMFFQKTLSFLTKNNDITHIHNPQYWFRDLFADVSDILNQSIVRCSNMEIIESSFNWAGLFNKHYREGTDYYADLKVVKGEFHNLIVYENTDNGFSLYDINELDVAMLEILSKPRLIKELLIEMQDYFDEDVLQNHYGTFEKLMLDSIKQLVVEKAIKPSPLYTGDCSFLRPVNLANKVRLGSLHDGGYVVYQPVLSATDVLITYGVGWDVAFEESFQALTGKKVWMYDPTMFNDDLEKSNEYVTKANQWKQKLEDLKNNNVFFANEGISTVQKLDYNTFENHLNANHILHEKILLKMDIEGDEYKIFSDDSFYNHLQTVNQIIVEFHDLKNQLKTLQKIITRLKNDFEIIHIHGNNNGKVFIFNNANSDIRFPDVVEVTLVRREYICEKDILEETVSYPVSGLDYPNNPELEDYPLIFCQLPK